MTVYLAVSPEQDSLAERAAGVLDTLGSKALETDGHFVVALAGGSTPRALYRRWAETSALDWKRVILLFGDERCVPAEDERSNYRMVRESLLDALSEPPEVLRVPGELSDAAAAARSYEFTLREALGPEGRIHVALLGLGEDGHTASLFPGGPALRENDAWCAGAEAPDGLARVTLTVPCLRRARKLMFLVAGAGKADIVRAAMEGPLDPEALPAQFFLRDDRLNVNLLLDEAAAANLSRRE